ncbi:plastocyanin/azurin family copper-binding protein [Halorussus rarus]|uniref:cupredoxin domain-containing protein n=1 Tax=Halorussus TaxID=1070314 RepID=UPI0013B3963A|nr:plastocyanin/azurin family copper-binding protein [Halorussus rarus]NHN58455.1 plasmid stabilization protein [Halorussus sp. JP-T4]
MGAVGGLGGLAAGQDDATRYELGGRIQGWQGRAPASIESETNPTLTLRPGTEYEVVWENLDGAPHNFTITDADGDDVASTETMSNQGETRTLSFTASEEMDRYVCTVHPSTMVGDIQAGGGATQTTQTTQQAAYNCQDATWDSYWYSLYNMNTTIAVSGVGVLFPHNEQQQQMFEQRLRGILQNADVDRPPIRNPNLNMAPFTEGDPQFTQQPVAPFSADVERIHADTMAWDESEMSGVVSPASVAWTHLKGVTWAKNFQAHFDKLPGGMAPKFRTQLLATVAQIAINATLIEGGPDGNGALTRGDDTLELVSGFNPNTGEVVDATARPMQHAAMLWFLSDMTSLAKGGWYGYVNPEPLIPAEKIQRLTDGMAKTTFEAFPPEAVLEMGSVRDLGVMLGAVGWYGTHAGSEELRNRATEYAEGLASAVEERLRDGGALSVESGNRAAAQGAVGQGLLWASQIPGVDREEMARPVLTYLLEDLWDEGAGTFADGTGDGTYTVTARDAGDITGGVNAADAVLGIGGAREKYASYFNQTFNRGRLQRAERPQSRSEDAEYALPLPQDAGGEFGQAAVYNTEVTYDTDADEWSVSNDRFTTAQALYLANQDIWIAQWAGDFFEGRGVPGTNDEPPESGSETTTGAGGTTTAE